MHRTPSRNPSQTTDEMASKSIAIIKRKNKEIKTKITKFSNYLKSNEGFIEIIECKLESIIDNFTNYKVILEEELNNIDDESIQNEFIEESLSIEDNYHETIAIAKKRINESSRNTVPKDQSVNSPTIVNNQSSQCYVKLPDITLPQFDGAWEDWPMFRDKFASRIDRNTNISEIDKLQYLQSSLSGKAARTIASLETTNNNYKEAWNLLKEKYENTRKIVARHWHILSNIPTFSRDTSENLEELVDLFRQHLRALKNLGVMIEHHDSILIHLISSKLTSNTLYNWKITLKDNKVPSYTSLLEFLERRIVYTTTNMNNTKNYMKGKNQVFHIHNASNNNELECHICKEPHKIYKCSKFLQLDIENRRKAVSDHNLCYNCLAKGHSARSCKSRMCYTCGKNHHSLLHLDNITNNNDPSL